LLNLADARPTAADRVAAEFGRRRVDRVRVTGEAGRAVADVTGVAHRYPQTFRLSLAAAARLAAAGIPVQIVRRRVRTADAGKAC
jgi:hypothetical protein